MAYRQDSIPLLLDQYQVRSLRRMAEQLGVLREQPASRAVLLERLAEYLGGPSHRQAMEGLLSLRHWQALSLEALKTGEPVSLYALRIRLRMLGANEEECWQILHDLLVNGCLILASTGHWSSSRWEIPSNPRDVVVKLSSTVVTLSSLTEAAAEHGGDDLPPPPCLEAPAVIKEASFDELQREIFLALRTMSEGSLRMTTRGLPYKVDLSRLAARVGTADFGSAGRRSATASPRLWFALSLLEATNLTALTGSGLRATAAAEAFLSLPSHEQVSFLHRAWLHSRFDEFRRIPTLSFGYYSSGDEPWADPDHQTDRDVPDLERLATARAAVASQVLELASNGWSDVHELARRVRVRFPEFLVKAPTYGFYDSPYHHYQRDPQIQRHYQGIYRKDRARQEALLRWDDDWPEVEGAYVAQVLAEPLHWLGIVDLGLDGNGRLISFRLSLLARRALLQEPGEERATSSSAPPLLVQPNFEVMVLEANANLALLARLDEFAERQRFDRAAVYRLTRDALVKGMARGLSGEAIINLLEGTSQGPLPQNVRYSLEEWVRLYESVHLRRRTALLEADSPEQLDGWLADPTVGPSLGRRLSPTTVLVPQQHWPQVVETLKQRRSRVRVVDYARKPWGAFQVDERPQIKVLRRFDEPHLRYQLSQLADLVAETDDGPVYQINRDSIQRALKAGQPAHTLDSYLRTRAVGKVPADVTLRVRGWAGLYSPLQYQTAVVLQAPLGFGWDDLEAVPIVCSRLLARIGPSLALVRPEHFDELREILEERGLTLAPGLSPALASGVPAPQAEGALADGTNPSRDGAEENDVFEAVANALAASPPDQASSGQLLVISLSQKRLLHFLDRARQRGQWIRLGWIDSQGDEVGALVRPTSLWKRKGDYFVNLVIKTGKTMTLPLTEIIGVAVEPEEN